MRIVWLVLVLGLGLGLVACRTTVPGTISRTPETSSSRNAVPGTPVPAVPTLADVLRLAKDTPRLRAARAAVSRDRGRATQADLLPNPIARVGIERIDVDDIGGGPGIYKASVRERIEIAGKQRARTDVALGRVRESEEDVRAEELRVTVEAARLHQRALFATLVSAARGEALAAEEERLVIAEAGFRSGRKPETILPALHRAVGQRRIALADEEERGRTTLRSLEGLLALPPGTFTGVALEPIEPRTLPEAGQEETRARIHEWHPDLAVWCASAERARAEVEHARALAWADVTFGFEFTSGEETIGLTRETLGVFVEMPLNLFDRNQGAIAAAEAEARRIREAGVDAAAELVARYAAAGEAVRTRTRNVAEYRDTITPALARDLEIATAAHSAGRTDRLPVLAARIALAEAVGTMARLEGDLVERTIEALAIIGRWPE